MRNGKIAWIGAALLALALVGGSVSAQGGGGFGGGGGRQGRGGMRGMQNSLARVPIKVLAATLGLSNDQQTRIAAIQKGAMEQGRALFSAGGPPDMDKLMALNTATDTQIKAVLTPAQQAKVPALLKYLGTLRLVGIPAQALPELKLTKDQVTKLTALANAAEPKLQQARQAQDRDQMRAIQTDTRTQAQSILTDAQKAILAKYPQRGGRRGQGGPGGPGGRGAPGA